METLVVCTFRCGCVSKRLEEQYIVNKEVPIYYTVRPGTGCCLWNEQVLVTSVLIRI